MLSIYIRKLIPCFFIVIYLQIFNLIYFKSFYLFIAELIVIIFSQKFGESLLRVILNKGDYSIFEALGVGYLSISLLVSLFVFIFSLNPALSIIPIVIGYIGLNLCIKMNSFPKNRAVYERSTSRLLPLFFTLSIVFLYAFYPLSESLSSVISGGPFPLHVDLLVQGGTLEQMSRGNSYGQQFAYGINAIFYHYAIFGLPSIFVSLLDLRGIDILLCWTIPFGLILLALCISDFTRAFSRIPKIALLAPIVLLIPDPSRYFFDGLFDVHYLFFASPGSIYGLIVSLWVIRRFVKLPLQHNNFYILYLLILLFNTRFHFFVLIFIFIFLNLIFENLKFSKLIKFSILTLLSIIIFLIVTHQNFYQSAIINFFEFHRKFLPKYVSSLFVWHSSRLSEFLIILVFSQGIFLAWAIYISLKKFGAVNNKYKPLHRAPLFLIMAYILTMIIAPMPHFGDSSEFTHRSFIVLYVFLVLYCYLFSRLVSRYLFCFCGAVFLLFALSYGAQRNYGQPLTTSDWYYSGSLNFQISNDLLAVSSYMKDRYQLGEGFVLYPQFGNDFSLADAVKISSLSTVPVYLSRPGYYLTDKSDLIVKDAERRLNLISSIGLDGLTSELIAKLRENNVRWIIFDSNSLINNPLDIKYQNFGGYTLVDLIKGDNL